MRNRGIEVNLGGVATDSLDLRILFAATGIPGMKLCSSMQRLHHTVAQQNVLVANNEKVSLHTAIQWAMLTVQATFNGWPLVDALRRSFERCVCVGTV